MRDVAFVWIIMNLKDAIPTAMVSLKRHHCTLACWFEIFWSGDNNRLDVDNKQKEESYDYKRYKKKAVTRPTFRQINFFSRLKLDLKPRRVVHLSICRLEHTTDLRILFIASFCLPLPAIFFYKRRKYDNAAHYHHELHFKIIILIMPLVVKTRQGQRISVF